MDSEIIVMITKDQLLNKTWIILIPIILLGFVLRAHNFTQSPRMGSTFDEYAWTWLGISLIQQKVPSSWSSYDQYVGYREHKIYQGARFWIVKPYLEHPPLFALLAGSFAIANGVDNMYDLTISDIRPLSLIMGILSIILLYILVSQLYSTSLGLLAAFIYSIIPTVVIGSRLVQNENFFIPMFTLSLIFIFKFIKTKKTIFFLLTAVICGILTLAKVPWIAAALSVGFILLYKRKYKHLFLLIGITTFIFSLFLIYGYHYNWDLFINLWKFQIERYEMAFNSIFALFTEPYLADRLTIDGWIYFGWISFFLLLAKDLKKNYILIFGLLGYFAVYVFAIPNTDGHGWYRYPFYPFLAVSLALFIKEYFNKNLLLTLLFVLFIGLSLLELTWASTFGFSFVILRLFLVACASTLLPLFFDHPKIKKYSLAMNYLLLLLLFSLNVWTIISFVDL